MLGCKNLSADHLDPFALELQGDHLEQLFAQLFACFSANVRMLWRIVRMLSMRLFACLNQQFQVLDPRALSTLLIQWPIITGHYRDRSRI